MTRSFNKKRKNFQNRFYQYLSEFQQGGSHERKRYKTRAKPKQTPKNNSKGSKQSQEK